MADGTTERPEQQPPVHDQDPPAETEQPPQVPDPEPPEMGRDQVQHHNVPDQAEEE